jgi:hypothetical protein
MQQNQMPMTGPMGGFAPDGGIGGPPGANPPPGPDAASLQAAGNPNMSALVQSAKPGK